MLKITNYSSYDNYTVKSNTENISNVIDKMVRLAAKLTEAYAGDIYYDIDSLCECIKRQKSLDCILFFNECGVWTVETKDIYDRDSIQTWRLTHDPETTTTTLVRVEIREENR